MVGGKHGDRGRGIDFRHAKGTVSDRGGGPAIMGLNDQVAVRKLGHHRREKSLMGAGNHHQGLRGIDCQRDTAERQLQQGFPLQQRAKLLGDITAQRTGQSAQALSFASGQDDRPSILQSRLQRARLPSAHYSFPRAM
jgi:hypothetical protein